MGLFSCSIPPLFVLSHILPMVNTMGKLALFGRFSITASSLPSRLTDHYSLATRFTSHVPRPTIVGVRRRCRAPNWVQHAPPGRRQYAMKSYIRAHFRAFYPHPAHKSALRAEVAAHFLAPGKRGWSPLATVLPSHAPRSASHAVTSGVRSCADPSPAGYCLTPTAELPRILRGPITPTGPPLYSMSPDGRFLRINQSVLSARRRPTVDHSLVAGGAQRQWLQACLPDGHKPQCMFSPLFSLSSRRIHAG